MLRTRLLLFFVAFGLANTASNEPNEMLQFITDLPKAELHLHLEGSLSPQTIVDLAVRNGVDSFKSVEEVEESLASRETGLIGFLTHYNEALKVLRTQQDFHQATYDLLETCRDNGIVYVELSFDPQAHTSRGILFDVVVNGIDEGRRAAAKDFGIEFAVQVRSGLRPCPRGRLPPNDSLRCRPT